MNSDNIFKKYINSSEKSTIQNKDDIDKKNSNSNRNEQIKAYVPPAKRIIKNNNKSENSNNQSKTTENYFKVSLKKNIVKDKRPLYKVTSEKLESLEIFPELSEQSQNKNTIQKAEWLIKKNDQDKTEEPNLNEELDSIQTTNENTDTDKLHVPEGWLLLSELNKGKSISQIEKEREERKNQQILEQYYVDLNYLMKERDAIKRKLYITCGEYFGHDSIILRDLPLKLDFMNESDNENENSSISDSEGDNNNSENEVEYDYEERY
jgi:hypothetical protein